jgi:hypothetical protein
MSPCPLSFLDRRSVQLAGRRASGGNGWRLGRLMGLMFLLVAVAAKSTAEEPGSAAKTPAADRPAETPDWAKTTQPPLWSFAWVSDMHLDGSRLEYMAKAMKLVHVYPRGLVVRTIHYDESGDRFEILGRRQSIEIA